MTQQASEDLRELEFLAGTVGVSDGNIEYVETLVRRHLATGQPMVLGLAENLGIESHPQPATA